ncbi:hypothetical protein KAFR_0B03610 [Kazachstania africana CBS 2517]|uniref:Glucose N-acetyltransferase 1 n=1 Tax=Kazachstania africana (strain ATCC 22294 / BCRC 22015 / CBS 2517 / CECT 1963 / NBRC 1671 / NRRL Y-8276) TaxID=1071382 RepID=H2AQK8_KAZAF|nr:hypothetical protein KAFR_0B03610 [Kazachstania africana CBS 2517]CCF56658.1 hypothetical protein KAFR_0B03610 [Kazachstania africana CBS 2517]
MRLISRRRLRFFLYVLIGFIMVTIITRGIVQFQLNKEIKYYKRFFKENKDSLEQMFNPLEIKQIPEEVIDSLYSETLSRASKTNKGINWDKFAYVNYVTDASYLCNTLIMFNKLKTEFQTKAKLVLLVTKDLIEDNATNKEKNILMLASIKNVDSEQVRIKYVDNIVKPKDYTPWNESLTKLRVFNETDFDRIIYMDNDAALTANLDELFFLPQYIKFAAPMTYWFISQNDLKEAYHELQHDDRITLNLNNYNKQTISRIKKGKMIYNHLPSLPSSLYLNSKNVAQEIISSTSSASPLFDFHTSKKASKIKFASNIMVIKPSKETFDKILYELLPRALTKKEMYDMDLINEELYNLKKIVYYQFSLFRKLKSEFIPEVMVLPFGRYGLLTGSLRNKNHYSMISNDILGYKRMDNDGNELLGLDKSVADAKYIHFSDYPIGKPWHYVSIKEFECVPDAETAEDLDQETKACNIWNSFYDTFIQARSICN